MHLQLLQLTCKCGHLHLGRGGREWEAGRSSSAFSLPKHKACPQRPTKALAFLPACNCPNSGLPGLLWLLSCFSGFSLRKAGGLAPLLAPPFF